MIEFFRKIIKKYKELILYVIFGVITTVVSLAACYAALKIGVNFLNDGNGNPNELLDIIGSTVQWVVGVLVAFFTNKIWVFEDKRRGFKAVSLQLAAFSSSRLATYFIEVLINLGTIKLLAYAGYKEYFIHLFSVTFGIDSRVWAKVVSSIVVVIGNYFISKFIIFRKNRKKVPETGE